MPVADAPAAKLPDAEVAEAMAEDAADAPTSEAEVDASVVREQEIQSEPDEVPHQSADPLAADEAGEDSITAVLTNNPVAVGDGSDPAADAAPADDEERALDQTAADAFAPPPADASGVDASLAGAAPISDANSGGAGVTPELARPDADDASAPGDGVVSIEEETPAGESV